MAQTNRKTSDHRLDASARTAGGMGAPAAKQDAEALLYRAVMANLLWEDLAYESGSTVVDQIRRLVPQVDPDRVAEIAIEAREDQKLRHVPLMLAREMARLKTHRPQVEYVLPRVITRADQLSEFMAMYLADGKQPTANAVKRGLAAAFQRFDAEHLAKYNRRGRQVKLKDVLFISHPEPKDEDQRVAFEQLANDALPVPDTWEIALSTGADKRETWERLINENKLGALAFMRNLRNMEEVGVRRDVIRRGFSQLKTEMLLPLNFFAAANAAPRWVPEIEDAMLGSLSGMPKLPGDTVIIVDVSGSMWSPISSRSDFSRIDAAAAMAVMAREVCEHVTIFVTAGGYREHKTEELVAHRGFALCKDIIESQHRMGGGGIFTRQAVDWVSGKVESADRLVVFSDSQDCDPSRALPKPFGKTNYIIDVSAHTRGVNYEGVWTAEISGWSERFITYISALESSVLQ